jgi:SIT4-associating protein SAP185/190
LNEVGSEEFIASRDAQRQLLRQEGRLLPARGEDVPSSVEDLHIRASHSSPEVISRKLEITNSSADDDGFEEVTHNADEDSSGVEELPEVPMPGPASSFLDKDEDDFVDEPLSSPRLHVREINDKDVPQLDDPELLVRPLSPTKQSVANPDQQKESELEKATEADLSLEDLSLEEKKSSDVSESQPAELERQESKSESSSQTNTPLLTPTTSEADPLPAEKLSVEPVKARTAPEEMSPHPEDTPAPLFSARHDAAACAPVEVPAVPDAPEVPEAPDAPAARGTTFKSDTQVTNAPNELPIQILPVESESGPDVADVSIVVGQMSEPTTPIDDTSPITPRPVVGDYLKMQFVENRVVPTILNFFFSYPWNNFLHNVVYDIVQQVFNGPMDRGYNPTLAISLFESADITNQIINGQLASERSQTVNKTRMGYMGHLTLIAEEVVKFTERHPPELLSDIVLEKVMAQDWINYVEGALAETRERDNAILGGVRPDVAHANRAGQGLGGGIGLGSIGLGSSNASSVLAEAGLNGGQDVSDNGGGSGIGPFAISAGTLMSGFGSSSDEDEDEEQDNEEDVNNEVGDFCFASGNRATYPSGLSGPIDPFGDMNEESSSDEDELMEDVPMDDSPMDIDDDDDAGAILTATPLEPPGGN